MKVYSNSIHKLHFFLLFSCISTNFYSKIHHADSFLL